MKNKKEAYEHAIIIMATTGKTTHYLDPIDHYVAELEARIAELEKENDLLEKAFDKSRERYDALKSRIESAPNMWLRYQKAAFGLKLVSVAEDQEELDADDIDVVQQVYAVPVEEEAK